MIWFTAFAILIVVVLGLAWWVRRGDVREVDPERRIPGGRLRETLEASGVDVSSTHTPDIDMLVPFVAADDDFVDAIQARSDGKTAVLVLLADRLVIAEATLGQMGGSIHVVGRDDLEQLDQDWDVGGEFEIETADGHRRYTHVPRSQTQDFRDALRDRLGG